MLWTAAPPAVAPTIRRSQIMPQITTIGLDIAKSVFRSTGSMRRAI